MKKISASAAARTIAFILCLLYGLSAVFCTVGYVAVKLDCDDSLPAPECLPIYRDELTRLLSSAIYSRYSTGELGEMPSGYSYVLTEGGTGEIGKVLHDSRTKKAEPLGLEVLRGDSSGKVALGELYREPEQPIGEELVQLRTSAMTLLRYEEVYLPLGIASAVLCLVLFIFLMTSVGKTPEGVKLRGVHRVPVDLFLGAALAAAAAVVSVADSLNLSWYLRYAPLWEVTLLAAFAVLAFGFIALLTLCTLGARLRAGKWWRNSIVYIVCRFGCRAVRGLVRELPVAWKGVLVYAAAVFGNMLGMILVVETGSFFVLLLLLAADLAGLYFVIRIMRQLRELQTAGEKLAAGDLAYTVETEKMYPVLKEHGDNLNAVGIGMSRAVNERMKSERFKTELITNVSHDLKTPLTSIVSYVDLLKKEPAGSEAADEYIAILDRQSQKLKKLTTDLVDASKASSGALPVSIEKIDLGELLRQSTGEYAEKFALAGIEPVLTAPEDETFVLADGRLLWRVIDNLLGNTVKYAQSGTRLYIDAVRNAEETVITLKNISREPLNIPAAELMERFVRGDASRHTDGSGLGLSIAKSLMELMGGELRLTLDGDLFKAALVFPHKNI